MAQLYSRHAGLDPASSCLLSAEEDAGPRIKSGVTTTLASALGFAGALVVAMPARADSNLPPAPYADTQLADPAKEAEAKALMETLRCLVCQGQAISDSNAEIAGDMRSIVRQRIEAGEKPAAIRAWLIRRYGNWVSYAPPLDRSTLLLWLAPLLLLLGGAGLAAGSLRRHRK